MNPPVKQRVSPNWVMLILAALLTVWLVVEFFPRKKPLLPPSPVAAESKLRSVGLEDNPDWEGLPEFFAVWADHAEWRNGRTRFAYWHPVMQTHSYYFEAIRNGERVSFQEITEPHEPDHFWDETLGEDSPIRFYHSVAQIKLVTPLQRPLSRISHPPPPETATRPDHIKPPPVELKLQPPEIEPKR